MQLGIGITTFPWAPEQIGPTVTRLARAADEAGFDSLWVMDHFFQIRLSGLPPESPMPEAYATLAYLGGVTCNIRLGTLVTSVAYRHPGVLVKAVTTLDVLTGGRVIFGVGAGAPWNVEPAGPGTAFEAEGLGIPFPSLAERFGRLEELLQIAHQMWRGDEAPYRGSHYQLVRPLNSPNCLQRPHPPILVGGRGERKTLRLVARYGDACNLFDTGGPEAIDEIRHKLEVLRARCMEAGRDYAAISKTTATSVDLGGDRRTRAAALLGHLHDLAGLGIDHVLLSPQRAWDQAALDALASILPDVHAIEPKA
jgi:F420-dependent oxidoreductase-like protein